MKITMFVSSREHEQVANQSAMVLASMQLLGNVTPILSSVLDKESGNYHVEHGAKIEVLSDVHTTHTHKVLKLWDRLRKAMGIHCVWIDIDGVHYIGGLDEHHHETEFHGCICEWGYYKTHHLSIGHSHPLSCSEYA